MSDYINKYPPACGHAGRVVGCLLCLRHTREMAAAASAALARHMKKSPPTIHVLGIPENRHVKEK